jgi:t-SNARE complex subunit (syntaxin)
LEQNITQIEELHDISLNSVSSEEHATRTNRQLESITADTTQLSNRIKKRIKGATFIVDAATVQRHKWQDGLAILFAVFNL